MYCSRRGIIEKTDVMTEPNIQDCNIPHFIQTSDFAPCFMGIILHNFHFCYKEMEKVLY